MAARITEVIEFVAAERPDLLAEVVALDASRFGEETEAPAWLAKRDLRIYIERNGAGVLASFVAVYDDGDNWHLWKTATRDDELRKGRMKRLINLARVRAAPRGLTVGTDPSRALFQPMVSFLRGEVDAGRAFEHTRATAKPGKGSYAYYRWPPLEA